jgi:hypothetical protein
MLKSTLFGASLLLDCELRPPTPTAEDKDAGRGRESVEADVCEAEPLGFPLLQPVIATAMNKQATKPQRLDAQKDAIMNYLPVVLTEAQILPA